MGERFSSRVLRFACIMSIGFPNDLDFLYQEALSVAYDNGGFSLASLNDVCWERLLMYYSCAQHLADGLYGL